MENPESRDLFLGRLLGAPFLQGLEKFGMLDVRFQVLRCWYSAPAVTPCRGDLGRRNGSQVAAGRKAVLAGLYHRQLDHYLLAELLEDFFAPFCKFLVVGLYLRTHQQRL